MYPEEVEVKELCKNLATFAVNGSQILSIFSHELIINQWQI